MALTQPGYPIATQDLATFLGQFSERMGGAAWFENAGHSLAAGGGARWYPDGGYAYRLHHALGAQRFRDYALGGAIACWPVGVATGDGGYGHILRRVKRPGMWVVENTNSKMPAAAAPYVPFSQFVNCHFGVNDLGELGANNPLPFQVALRTILSRFCAAAVFVQNAPQFVYTGTWGVIGVSETATCNTDGFQGIAYSSTVGSKVVFTTPADFPASRTLSFGIWCNSVWGQTTIGVKVNGVALPDISFVGTQICDQGAASKHNVHTVRFGNGVAGNPFGAALPAGANTVELSVKAGTVAIDNASIESDPLDGPIIICPLPNKPANYSIWSTWPGGPSMNDAVIDTWKGYERSILAEFPGRIIEVDLDEAALVRTTDGTGDFYSDGAHPNERGHGKWAKLIYDKVVNSPLVTDRFKARPSTMPLQHWQQVGKMNGSGVFAVGWSNFGNAALPDLMWRRDDRGYVRVRGCIKAAVGVGTTILAAATLPKPSVFADFTVPHYDGAAWVNRVLRVGNDGSLALATAPSTTAGNGLMFDITYEAEVP